MQASFFKLLRSFLQHRTAEDVLPSSREIIRRSRVKRKNRTASFAARGLRKEIIRAGI